MIIPSVATAIMLCLAATVMAQPGQGRGGPGGQGRGGPGGPGGQGRGGPGGPGGGPGGDIGRMMQAIPVLAALDADKDGELSAKEIANASKALAKDILLKALKALPKDIMLKALPQRPLVREKKLQRPLFRISPPQMYLYRPCCDNSRNDAEETYVANNIIMTNSLYKVCVKLVFLMCALVFMRMRASSMPHSTPNARRKLIRLKQALKHMSPQHQI